MLSQLSNAVVFESDVSRFGDVSDTDLEDSLGVLLQIEDKIRSFNPSDNEKVALSITGFVGDIFISDYKSAITGVSTVKGHLIAATAAGDVIDVTASLESIRNAVLSLLEN